MNKCESRDSNSDTYIYNAMFKQIELYSRFILVSVDNKYLLLVIYVIFQF